MPFLLKFTPVSREGLGQYVQKDDGPYYLVHLGPQWPHDPRYRLIDETTRDKTKAKQFDTEDDARTCWNQANRPNGWEVVSA
jgi:hypothetical protein